MIYPSSALASTAGKTGDQFGVYLWSLRFWLNEGLIHHQLSLVHLLCGYWLSTRKFKNQIDFNYPYLVISLFLNLPKFAHFLSAQLDLSCDLQIQLRCPGRDSWLMRWKLYSKDHTWHHVLPDQNFLALKSWICCSVLSHLSYASSSMWS